MPIVTIGRDKIRGKHLEPFCYKAETVRDGQDKREVYCRGYDREECHHCCVHHPLEWYEDDLQWYTK